MAADAKPDIETPKDDAPDAEATQDAAFAEAFDKVDTVQDEPAPKIKEKAKAKVEEDDADEPEPDEGDESGQEELPGEDDDLEGSADEGEPEAGDEEEDDEELELHRAYTTLHDKLDVPTSVLKNMPKAKLIAWAKRVDAKEAEAAGASSAAKRGSDLPEGAKATGEPAQAAAPIDWATFRASVAEKLGVDEDAAEVLKPLHDANESLRAEVKELRTLVGGATAAMREREGQATIDRNTRRLQDRYPELKTSAKAREKLLDEAQVLLKGGLRDEKKLFDKAALLAFGAGKRTDLAQLRRNGVSAPPPSRGGITAPSTEDEYYQKALDYVDAGRPELARRLPPPPPRERRR